jgi:hypothetical protein
LETLIRDCQCQLESFAMWRFLANVTDPNDPKDKQNKAKDRKEEYKEYESKKRSRSYQTAWESEFTWLQYKESECKMYCKLKRSQLLHFLNNGHDHITVFFFAEFCMQHFLAQQ